MVYEKRLLELKKDDGIEINGIPMKVLSSEEQHSIDRTKNPVQVDVKGMLLRLISGDDIYELYVPIEPKDLVFKKIKVKEYMSPPMEDVEVLEEIPIEVIK